QAQGEELGGALRRLRRLGQHGGQRQRAGDGVRRHVLRRRHLGDVGRGQAAAAEEGGERRAAGRRADAGLFRRRERRAAVVVGRVADPLFRGGRGGLDLRR